jgi:hypothetical protein
MYMIKTFPSAVLSSNQMRGQILAHMQRVEKAALDDFNKTTETWRHSVTFEHSVGYSGGNAVISIKTSDEAWFYLDEGTSVRYATMTTDFVNKTVPHWIGSQTGGGHRAYVSRKYPRPGIVARKWSDDIFDKYFDILQLALDQAIQRGMQP